MIKLNFPLFLVFLTIPYILILTTMLKVLLIEDEVKLLQSLKQGLEENHIEVETARDGELGIALLEKTITMSWYPTFWCPEFQEFRF